MTVREMELLAELITERKELGKDVSGDIADALWAFVGFCSKRKSAIGEMAQILMKEKERWQ